MLPAFYFPEKSHNIILSLNFISIPLGSGNFLWSWSHAHHAKKISAEPPLRTSPIISGHRTQGQTYVPGGQDKHVWLVVKQVPMRAGWWDAPLVLLELAVAISIPTIKISYSLIEAKPRSSNTSQQLKTPYTRSSLIFHIYSTLGVLASFNNTRNTKTNSSTR